MSASSSAVPSQVEIAPIAPKSVGRILQLDVLRGVAILLVLFRHPGIRPQWAKQWRLLSTPLYHLGWTGVDLFFVLSGFLIGGLLFSEIRKTAKLDVKRFLIRRGFKIWPSYFLLIFVAIVADYWGDHHATPGSVNLWHTAWQYWPNLVHLQNYFGSPRGQTWSLAVEEHFYLALPLLLIFLIRKNNGARVLSLPALPWIALGVAIGCLSLRLIYLLPIFPHNFAFGCGHTEIRMDSLFFGVFLAYMHHFHPQRLASIARRRGLLLLLATPLLLPFLFVEQWDRFARTIGDTMLYLAYGAILIAAVYSTTQDWFGRILHSWPARTVGVVGVFSYSIYLWQYDLAIWPFDSLLPHLPRLPSRIYYPLLQPVFLACACVAGAIMAKIVEVPSLALREKLFPSRVREPAPAPLHPTVVVRET